jgi:hypothetical protein
MRFIDSWKFFTTRLFHFQVPFNIKTCQSMLYVWTYTTACLKQRFINKGAGHNCKRTVSGPFRPSRRKATGTQIESGPVQSNWAYSWDTWQTDSFVLHGISVDLCLTLFYCLKHLYNIVMNQTADNSGRSDYCMNCFRPPKHWCRSFKSHSNHGCLLRG